MPAPYDKTDYHPTDTFAFEQITVAGTAVGFTAGTVSPGGSDGERAMAAHVKCETAQVRYRIDGTDPTATVGTILDAGNELIVWGQRDIDSIKFIRTGGVSAILNVHYAR